MPVLLTAPSAGDLVDATIETANLDQIEASFTDLGPFVISGLTPTAGAGLSVNVSAGTASIGGRITASGSFAISGLTPSATNHLYLQQSGSGTSNTTGTQPANTTKLGTATTDATSVTAVSTTRSSGRQLKVRGEDMVPGAVGSPATLSLASWNASPGDGFQFTGSLPSGAITLPANAFLKDSDQTLSDGTDIAVGTTTGTKIGTSTSQRLSFFNATPIVQPATNSDIRSALINLGLLAGGANPLNTNGADVICNILKTSSGIQGSGTPLTLPVNTITPGSDTDVTVSTPQADLVYQRLDTGSWTAGHNVILPTVTGALYLVRNNTAFSATFKTSAGTGVAVAAGDQAWISCGGANYLPAAPSVTLGGDVTGATSANTVTKLRGKALPAAPGSGQDWQALRWNNGGNTFEFSWMTQLTMLGVWSVPDISALGTTDAESNNSFTLGAGSLIANQMPQAGAFEWMSIMCSGDIGAAATALTATVYKNGSSTALSGGINGGAGNEHKQLIGTELLFSQADEITIQCKRTGTLNAVAAVVTLYGYLR